MKVAIISDIHDNIAKLQAALERAADCSAIICCGDLCSPFIVRELGEGFKGPIHVVFGNNDGDRYRITEVSKTYSQIQLHGEFVELELNGILFGVNHFDHIGRALADVPRFDVVCYGHNHQFEIKRTDRKTIINPGEIFGGLTGHSTFVIFDTESMEAIRVDL